MSLFTLKSLLGSPGEVKPNTIAAETAVQMHADKDTIFIDVRSQQK